MEKFNCSDIEHELTSCYNQLFDTKNNNQEIDEITKKIISKIKELNNDSHGIATLYANRTLNFSLILKDIINLPIELLNIIRQYHGDMIEVLIEKKTTNTIIKHHIVMKMGFLYIINLYGTKTNLCSHGYHSFYYWNKKITRYTPINIDVISNKKFYEKSDYIEGMHKIISSFEMIKKIGTDHLISFKRGIDFISYNVKTSQIKKMLNKTNFIESVLSSYLINNTNYIYYTDYDKDSFVTFDENTYQHLSEYTEINCMIFFNLFHLLRDDNLKKKKN